MIVMRDLDIYWGDMIRSSRLTCARTTATDRAGRIAEHGNVIGRTATLLIYRDSAFLPQARLKCGKMAWLLGLCNWVLHDIIRLS
jgi:hypothetical protein